MKMPDCHYRTSIKGLITNDQNQFLLVKEESSLWELPGGGLDFGETPQQCLTREIQEEMNLQVTSVASQPTYYFTFLDEKGRWRSNVVYQAQVQNLEFTPSAECIEMRFCTIETAAQLPLYTNVTEFLKHHSQSFTS